jgi:hypothetical protein
MRAGEVAFGHAVVTLLVTVFPVHSSCPDAVSVEDTEQASAGAKKLPVKLADAPGANVVTLNTGEFATGRLLTTMMFVSVMFPALLTVPL